MAEEDRNIHWSDQLENLIAAEAERCRGYAWIHQKSEGYYSRRNNGIAIPVIILSTLAGTASVGSSTLFAGDTQISSVSIGLVSIIVGILNTIQSYFAFSRKAEAHRIAYLSYSKLFSNVSVELSLPRNERMSPEQVLKTLRDNMERLAETTPTPPACILAEFNRHFKDEDKTISRPVETNGLQKIIIYRDNPLYTPKNLTPRVDDKDHSSEEDRRREGR